MNMFTDECIRDYISLSVSGMFITVVCVCLCSFCFTNVRLIWVSVQGCFRHPVTFLSPSPTSYVFLLSSVPPSPLCQHPVFFLSVIFPCRVVAVMHFAVSLSVQPVCGLCYCMHMQFNYWCSPLTASSALYGSLPLCNIPGDIVLCGAEYVNVSVCVCVRAAVEIVFFDLAFVWIFLCLYSMCTVCCHGCWLIGQKYMNVTAVDSLQGFS